MQKRSCPVIAGTVAERGEELDDQLRAWKCHTRESQFEEEDQRRQPPPNQSTPKRKATEQSPRTNMRKSEEHVWVLDYKVQVG